jgi:2-methylcitrate dehydratase
VDRTTEVIAEFVEGLTADLLPDHVRHETKRRLVDSVGCAIGAIDAPPVRIARSMATEISGNPSATVVGGPRRTSIEMATFANTVMVRYLDFNDMYFSANGGGGHPSDLIPSVLAVGQAAGVSGLDVLLATSIAYEVNGALAGAVWLRQRGWDQGFNVVVASAAAAGKLLGLSREELGNAISLAVTPNVPVRQTRVGELSMWKGCATAGAARNGVFAALLASKGMTGPPSPFEGAAGIWEQVTGPFQLELSTRPASFAIEQVHTKYRPAEYNAQAPLDLILRLRDRVKLDDLERIDVDTYYLTYDEIGSQPEKWDPHTRETADHSLPYMLAVALIDGDVGLDSFTPERVADPRLRPLMRKIHIAESADFTRRFPAELLCRITTRSASGQTISDEIAYPKGHTHNPVSDADIDYKFDRLAERRGAADATLANEVRNALWTVEAVKDVSTILEPLGSLDAG